MRRIILAAPFAILSLAGTAQAAAIGNGLRFVGQAVASQGPGAGEAPAPQPAPAQRQAALAR